MVSFVTGLTDPVADVDNFIREYDISYGRNHPRFYRGAYSEVSVSRRPSPLPIKFCDNSPMVQGLCLYIFGL